MGEQSTLFTWIELTIFAFAAIGFLSTLAALVKWII